MDTALVHIGGLDRPSGVGGRPLGSGNGAEASGAAGQGGGGPPSVPAPAPAKDPPLSISVGGVLQAAIRLTL